MSERGRPVAGTGNGKKGRAMIALISCRFSPKRGRARSRRTAAGGPLTPGSEVPRLDKICQAAVDKGCVLEARELMEARCKL